MKNKMSKSDIFSMFSKETKYENNEELLRACSIGTPLGEMIAIGDDNYLYILEFVDGKKLQKEIKHLMNETHKDIVIGESLLLADLKKELAAYFEGKLKELCTPIKLLGTAFQKECWTELGRIRFGETLSYSQLASRLGKGPRYSRAVGSAAGANPLIILVPCHRLIASGGKQGGFSSGKDRKTWLMGHEQKHKK